LPTTRGAESGGAPGPTGEGAAADADADLPVRKPEPALDLDLDLPGLPEVRGPSRAAGSGAASGDRPTAGRGAPPPPKGRGTAKAGMAPVELDLDLPAVPDKSRGADLPAVPRPRVAAGSDPDGELDLPSPVGGVRSGAKQARRAEDAADLPVVRGKSTAKDEVGLPEIPGAMDLPANAGAAAASAPSGISSGRDGEVGLPSPAGGVDLPSLGGELDLPSPGGGVDLPSPGGGVDLPSPSGGADLPSVGGELDLPSPGGGVDVPSPSGGADLPSVGGELDLPSPGGGVDLPSPSAGVDLPSPSAGVDLPSPDGAIDLAVPSGEFDLSSLGASPEPEPSPGGIDLPPQTAALDATVPGMPAPDLAPAAPLVAGAALDRGATAAGIGAPASAPQDAFGELELPMGGGAAVERPAGPGVLPGDLSAEPVGSEGALGLGPDPFSDEADVGLVREEGGGTAYGEVHLDDADGTGELGLDAADPGGAAADDDMEFGAIPQEDDGPSVADGEEGLRTAAVAGATMAAEAGRARGAKPAQPAEKKKKGIAKLLVAGAVALAVGGGALALVPSVGPFGYYLLEGILRGGEHRALVAETAEETHKQLAVDTYPAARRALQEIEQKRGQAKRLESLTAYMVYVSYLNELRFGPEPRTRARAKVLLDELAEATQVDYLELARAAQQAVSGTLARSHKTVQTLARRQPKDIDVLVLRAEVELRARDPKAAVEAWKAAAAVEKSARTSFGLARACWAAEDRSEAEKHAKDAIELSKGHAGARILLARIEWKSRAAEKPAVELLERAKQSKNASPDELVSLYTLLGDIHLERSRISHAESSYGEALKINPKSAGALRGLGETLYRAGRYTEALARFEAGAQADPDDVSVKVGVAKLLLALERLQDAKAMLEKLQKSHPKSMHVAYWKGKSLEAVGNRDAAEEAYRRAIKFGGSSPEVVDAYVALAMVLNQKGQEKDARRTLDEAQRRLPDSPRIHKALGELAMTLGRYDTALEELRTALKLDPEDVGVKFRLGVTLRRDRQFDEASKVFDEVSKVDRDYPGLALERGLLFEASGRSEEALKSYESALAKAPNDPDLMLRVGCAKVAAGHTERALDLLRKVLAQRPHSAEVNHCLGRALLLEKNLAEALKKLERAAALDPHRAEYHLYVGWAANEAGDSFKAQKALARALELDKGLADAYWQRGILAYRQGRVTDAVNDLKKALQLRPSRDEAHAALAQAYYDLGQDGQAIAEWRAAIDAQPDNSVWRYRFGRILAANNNHEAAQVQLGKALELAEKEKGQPRWVVQAHLLLARSMGTRPEAIPHWQAFLKDGPVDSPYRAEAEAALRTLGKPWTGN
jgi:tetratricopeptide (TPR) repeat protein